MKDKLDVDKDQMRTSEGSSFRAWCSKRVSCCPLGLAETRGLVASGEVLSEKGRLQVCPKGRCAPKGGYYPGEAAGGSWDAGRPVWVLRGSGWCWVGCGGKDQGSCQLLVKSCLLWAVCYRVTLHLLGLSYLKIMVQGLPWWSNGWHLVIAMLGTWFRSLVRELRSHMPCDMAKK